MRSEAGGCIRTMSESKTAMSSKTWTLSTGLEAVAKDSRSLSDCFRLFAVIPMLALMTCDTFPTGTYRLAAGPLRRPALRFRPEGADYFRLIRGKSICVCFQQVAAYSFPST